MNKIEFIVSGCRSVDCLPKDKVDNLMLAVPNVLKSKSTIKSAKAISKKCESLYLDSGGRQIYMVTSGQRKKYDQFISDKDQPVFFGNTLNIHIEHLKNAVEIFQPDYLLGLDFPVKPCDDINEQNKRYRESVKRNVSWAEQTISLRDGHFKNLKVILPLQTQNIENLRNYWAKIRHLNPDGVGLPMRCFKNNGRLLEFLLEMHRLGIRNVHLLGSSKLAAIIISGYLVKNNFFDTITMDSGTWRQAADTENFLFPFDLRQVYISNPKELINNQTIKLSDAWLDKIEKVVIQAGTKNERFALRKFNFKSIQTTIDGVMRHAETIPKLTKYLLERSRREVDIMKVVSLLKEKF